MFSTREPGSFKPPLLCVATGRRCVKGGDLPSIYWFSRADGLFYSARRCDGDSAAICFLLKSLRMLSPLAFSLASCGEMGGNMTDGP